MVFTKLSTQEKDAFFGLLDEYFQSRPELFGQRDGVSGLAGTGISTAAAASALQRVAVAASTAGSTGGANTTGASGFKSTNPYAAAIATPNSADVARAVSVGRVAAASLALSQGGGGGGAGAAGWSTAAPSVSAISQASAGLRPLASAMSLGGGDTGGGPPTPPRRAGVGGALSVPVPAAPARAAIPGMEVDKLVTRKVGMLDAFKKKPASVAGMPPPAFEAPKNVYGPPPVRRVASDTGTGTGARATPVPPEEEEVAEGEWAEVLYDYSSEDPGDLAIEAGTRVLVTAKSSEDWWTGRVEGQGKEGLFPASYVQLL